MRGENNYACLTCGFTMSAHTAYCPQCESLKAQRAMAEAAAASAAALSAASYTPRQVEIIYTPALTKEQYASQVAREISYHRESVRRGTIVGLVQLFVGASLFGYMTQFGLLGAIMGIVTGAFFVIFGFINMS